MNREYQWPKAIFESAIDGIIIINKKGIICHVNNAACTLFQYSKEELLDQNVRMLMPFPHARDHDTYIDNYHQSHTPKIIGIGREVEGKRKDGSLFPFRLAVSESMIDGSPHYVGFVHNLSEIHEAKSHIENLNKELEKKVIDRTYELEYVVNKLLKTNTSLQTEIEARKETEDKLRESEIQLRDLLNQEIELNNLKSQFVSMASHEFKTPLSTILLSTNLIGKYHTTEDNDKRLKHVERIKNAVSYLDGVLNDFLLLRHIENGKIEVMQEQFCIKELISDVVEELRDIKKPHIRINEYYSGETRLIDSDKRIVRGILYNLLSNALKYSGDSDVIDVTINYNRPARIVVRDYGIGIPEEDQNLLFTRFFRSSNTTNIPGTGLGLNIVRHYLDVLGGDIEVESTEGEGSTFTVYIPYVKNENNA